MILPLPLELKTWTITSGIIFTFRNQRMIIKLGNIMYQVLSTDNVSTKAQRQNPVRIHTGADSILSSILSNFL